jgi:hypothetical protein
MAYLPATGSIAVTTQEGEGKMVDFRIALPFTARKASRRASHATCYSSVAPADHIDMPAKAEVRSPRSPPRRRILA